MLYSSWNSAVVTTWISLIGGPLRTSNKYNNKCICNYLSNCFTWLSRSFIFSSFARTTTWTITSGRCSELNLRLIGSNSPQAIKESFSNWLMTYSDWAHMKGIRPAATYSCDPRKNKRSFKIWIPCYALKPTLANLLYILVKNAHFLFLTSFSKIAANF